MTKISNIADALGRKEIAKMVGVSEQMVYNRVSQGKFPASWLCVIKGMCEVSGLEGPDLAAFNFKAALVDVPKSTSSEAAQGDPE